jgi:hypothetical protein
MRAQLQLEWLMAERAWERTQTGREFVIRSRVPRQIYLKWYSGIWTGDKRTPSAGQLSRSVLREELELVELMETRDGPSD